MSAFDELAEEGILTKKQIRQLKIQAKPKIAQLKLIRAFNERVYTKFAKLHRMKSGRWDTSQNKATFAKQMRARSVLNRRIFRLGGERKAPVFDPY